MTTNQSTPEVLETNDLPLTANQIGQLENAEEVIHFFAQLGYDVDQSTPVAHATLGLDGNDVRLEIQKILRVGADPDQGDIVIYLLEVKAVTLSLVQKIARRFRTRPELAPLVLTADYETLDFVLLDRTQEKSTRIGQPLKQVIRPRHLTVARRRPAPVALRVLRRFTFTEGDSLLQWEKLRSAYALAEWTEEYFNNRALFADHYLKTRFTDAAITPTWATVGDCRSDLFQKFMAGGKPPTLAVISDIMRSKKELAPCAFAGRIYVDAEATIFGDEGVAGLLVDKANIGRRNRAAHDTVLSREDALAARAWALGILARL